MAVVLGVVGIGGDGDYKDRWVLGRGDMRELLRAGASMRGKNLRCCDVESRS